MAQNPGPIAAHLRHLAHRSLYNYENDEITERQNWRAACTIRVVRHPGTERIMLAGLVICASIIAWAVAAGQGTHEQGDPENIRMIASIDGPTLYRTYCAVCHGNNGKGGGPMAASLKVAPSDLTRIAERHGGEFPLAVVEKIISGEEEVTEGHGTRAMPIWGPIFSQIAWDQDLGRLRIRNLTTYLQSIQAK